MTKEGSPPPREVEFVDITALCNPEVPIRLRLLMVSHRMDEATLAAKAGVALRIVRLALISIDGVRLGQMQAIAEALNVTLNDLAGEFDFESLTLDDNGDDSRE